MKEKEQRCRIELGGQPSEFARIYFPCAYISQFKKVGGERQKAALT